MESHLLNKTLLHTARILRFPLGRLFNCPPVLFLHIQKTAGNSLVGLLRVYYQWSYTMHTEYAGKSPGELEHLSFVSGHFGYDYASSLMPSRYTFTFLRHPGERILSLYYFCRTRDPGEFPIYRIARESSLEEFLEAGFQPGVVREHIWNHQAWQLAHGWGSRSGKSLEDFRPDEIRDLALAHVPQFSYVGLTETFDEDCINILRALNIPPLKKMYIVNPTQSRHSIREISPYARKLLEQLTALDWKLYDAVIERRRAQGGPDKNRNTETG